MSPPWIAYVIAGHCVGVGWVLLIVAIGTDFDTLARAQEQAVALRHRITEAIAALPVYALFLLQGGAAGIGLIRVRRAKHEQPQYVTDWYYCPHTRMYRHPGNGCAECET